MKKDKHILFISHYSALYGANRSLLDLIDRFKEKNLHVSVVLREPGELERELQQRNTDYHVIPFVSYGEYRWKSGTLLGSIFWDTIHYLKGIRGYFLNTLYSFKLNKVCRDFGVTNIYLNGIMTLAPGFLTEGVFQRKSSILHIREHPELQFGILPYLGYNHIRRRINTIDKVLFVSEYLKTTYQDFGLVNGLTQRSVHNCIRIKNNQEFDYNSTENRPINGPSSLYVFGIFGSISGVKNQMEALRCFYEVTKEIDNTKLIVVGEGNLRPLLDYVKAHLLSDKVEFTGYLKNVEPIYRKVNTCLVCSDNEAFGRVTVESLLFGRPVIAKNSGAHSEVLDNGRFGTIYNDDRELIYSMIDHVKSYSKYERRVNENMEEIKQRYSYPGQIDRIIEMI